MSYLIFCSYEVGGLPFRMAEVLNAHGVETYYISLARRPSGHDSSQFHYGIRSEKWDLSHLFADKHSSREIVSLLADVKKTYMIDHCLATGSKAYLLKKVGINYNYWAYGSDIDQMFLWPFILGLLRSRKGVI